MSEVFKWASGVCVLGAISIICVREPREGRRTNILDLIRILMLPTIALVVANSANPSPWVLDVLYVLLSGVSVLLAAYHWRTSTKKTSIIVQPVIGYALLIAAASIALIRVALAYRFYGGVALLAAGLLYLIPLFVKRFIVAARERLAQKAERR